MHKFTTAQFIDKSKEIHGDKYDYSESNYIGSSDKVQIICKKHGSFQQNASSHMRGGGCKKCQADNQKYTTQTFIEKAKEVHGDKYDYSLVDYKHSNEEVKIICNKHGLFEQKAYGHVRGKGCKKCRVDKISLTQEEFIERAKDLHGDKYDYSKVEYSHSQEKVTIICKTHGEFQQLPNSHLSGSTCLKCAIQDKHHTQEYFVNQSSKVHNNKYSYDKTIYTRSDEKVIITCPTHGDFHQLAGTHISGGGCKKCYNELKVSKGENELSDFINYIYHGEIIKNSRDIIEPLELDVYLPDIKIAFEYNGLYWHSSNKINPDYHYNKTKMCADKGIRLIQIWEDEWTINKDQIKKFISSILGIREYIPLEKTYIAQIKNIEEDNIQFGLYYKENKLIKTLTLNYIKDGEYELEPINTIEGYEIIGGDEIFFNSVINKIEWSNITYKTDLEKYSDELPIKLGMYYVNHLEKIFYTYNQKRYNDKIKKAYTVYTSGINEWILLNNI